MISLEHNQWALLRTAGEPVVLLEEGFRYSCASFLTTPGTQDQLKTAKGTKRKVFASLFKLHQTPLHILFSEDSAFSPLLEERVFRYLFRSISISGVSREKLVLL